MRNHLLAGLAGSLVLLGGCALQPFQNSLNAPLTGSVQILMSGASRTTQARMTDIDHVLFTLESPNRASNAQSPTTTANQTVTYTDGMPNQGTVRFNNLWPGVATISATISGVNPIRTQAIHTQSLLEELGSITATVSVVSGQITQVPLSIKMDNTQTRAGALNINLGIQEGDEELLQYPYAD